MSTILELIRKLYPFAYSITSRDSDRAIPAFRSELPFTVHEWPSGLELNGWQIPPAWSVEKAEIRRDGQLVWDGRSSPLGVVWLSPSFSGTLDLDELRPRLFYSEEDPEAVVYHWGGLYRPAERQWGFCMPRRLVETLQPGRYDIELVTEFDPEPTMKVLDFVLPGETETTILFNAHNCHPFQANDDLSGCAVGIRLMQRLAALPQRRFTYRLVIGPELVGTVFWADALGDSAHAIAAAILFKSVGNDAPLRLQDSFTGTAGVDRAAHHVFGHRFGSFGSGAFRTVYGNDETVFEAPGFEIPSISLTRVPFREYHTDLDTPDRLSEARLSDTLDTAFAICEAMEKDRPLRARFKGLISLSNPRYDLYRRAPAPGLDKDRYDQSLGRWNHLMNCLPRYLDGRMGVLEMADRHGLPVADVHDYVARWVEKGLAEWA